MGEMFNDQGRLNIPELEKLNKEDIQGTGFVIKKAFCPNGHSLISDSLVDGHNGIKLYITDNENKKKAEALFSPIVGCHKIVIIKGDEFKPGEITKMFCPVCHTELEILHDCDCGGYMYVFYMDSHLDRNFGISFCSKLACMKSSRLRFSKDAITEYLKDHIL